MESWHFTEQDRWQMAALGISEARVRDQLRFFSRPRPAVKLARPCTLGDGIRRLAPGEQARYLALQAEAASRGRFLKFVPASGAASRMFQAPLSYLAELPPELVAGEPPAGVPDPPPAGPVAAFCQALSRFAFFPDLARCLKERGLHPEGLLAAGAYHCALFYLLTPAGLNYAALPKGLLKFHRYGQECRTALEEHLVEAAFYVRDWEGRCRLHVTVLPEHRELFAGLLREAQPRWEVRLGCRFQVEFSCQSHATDTLAVDLDLRPFREEDGRLHFRPGGHGALLTNLQDCGGDLVYIKNIDNVVPDRLKEPTILWKRLMGGLVVEVEGRLHGLLRQLTAGETDPGLLADAAAWAREELAVSLPPEFAAWPGDRRREFLVAALNRPLRVCGVVKNEGEPGGAPFWVREPDGGFSRQIVEGAQVDLADPEQRAVWEAATHFNPVDLVVTLRDYQGRPFELQRFADPEAVFISRKSYNGRKLLALELPGLWNGGMARWLTLFVEVPAITFNPVKTALDLLRPEHLPE
ncbi:MAG: DUF4301 family protein [Syntrophobacterales bacterium]|nr:DUF4301 family protein [Syntrophobacterales bacterium]